MAKKFVIRDETGAADLVAVDESRQLDIGGSVPGAPISIDGTIWRKTDGNLGDTRAPSKSLNRTTGSVTVNANSSATVTHNRGRRVLLRHQHFVGGSIKVFIAIHNINDFALENISATNRTVNYVFV